MIVVSPFRVRTLKIWQYNRECVPLARPRYRRFYGVVAACCRSDRYLSHPQELGVEDGKCEYGQIRPWIVLFAAAFRKGQRE